MTLIYPKEHIENAPIDQDVDIITDYDELNKKISGLYDTFVVFVSHKESVGGLNYAVSFDRLRNLHILTTFIDCRYKSDNLKLLIDKFKAFENAWM